MDLGQESKVITCTFIGIPEPYVIEISRQCYYKYTTLDKMYYTLVILSLQLSYYTLHNALHKEYMDMNILTW